MTSITSAHLRLDLDVPSYIIKIDLLKICSWMAYGDVLRQSKSCFPRSAGRLRDSTNDKLSEKRGIILV